MSSIWLAIGICVVCLAFTGYKLGMVWIPKFLPKRQLLRAESISLLTHEIVKDWFKEHKYNPETHQAFIYLFKDNSHANKVRFTLRLRNFFERKFHLYHVGFFDKEEHVVVSQVCFAADRTDNDFMIMFQQNEMIIPNL